MRKFASFLATIGILTFGCSESDTSSSISVTQLKEISESGREIYVIDVRTEPEFIEGHLSFTDDLISHDKIEENLDRLPKDKETEIYLFCRSGRRSGIITRYLVSIGYTNVSNVVGGIIAWKNAGYEIETGNSKF